MTMYGAIPAELSSLGSTLQRQNDPIDSVMSTVRSVLGGTTWEGPARTQFESNWNDIFVKALMQLKEAFNAAGQDCVNRSADLERVMGAR